MPQGAQLIRRINPKFCDWDELDDEGRPRITRQAVQFYRDEEARQLGCPGPAMSFILETSDDDLEAIVERHSGYGFARIAVSELRGDGALGAQLWPTEETPFHVVVFRLDGGSRPSSAQAKRIAEELTADWLIVPTRPSDAV